MCKEAKELQIRCSHYVFPRAPPGDRPARLDDHLILHHVVLQVVLLVVLVLILVVEVVEIVRVDLVREAVVVVAVLVAVGGAAALNEGCTFNTIASETNWDSLIFLTSNQDMQMETTLV